MTERLVAERARPRIHGLGCPNCGGNLDLAVGLRVVECPFCATVLLATNEIGIRRFTVEARVDSVTARDAVRKWLARGFSKDPRLRREARVGEAFLCFVPFYRVQADCLGFALGTEQRTRTVGSGKRRRVETYEVDVERSVERSFDRTWPAVNIGEWGVRRVALEGDRMEPFDGEALARLGMVFPPTASEGSLLQHALEQFRLRADPAAGLHRVRFEHLETLRERLSVVYYPLWVVRYAFRERSYQVLIDAEDGSLAAGKAPGNDAYRAAMLVLTQAVALFVGTTALQLVGLNLGALAFVGVPLGLALLWGWRRFRHGGVIVEGSGVEGEEGLFATIGVRTGPERQAEFLRQLSGLVPGW